MRVLGPIFIAVASAVATFVVAVLPILTVAGAVAALAAMVAMLAVLAVIGALAALGSERRHAQSETRDCQHANQLTQMPHEDLRVGKTTQEHPGAAEVVIGVNI